MNRLKRTGLAILCVSLGTWGMPVSATITTHVNEDFADLSEWTIMWGSSAFDQSADPSFPSKTVVSATNTTASTIRRDDVGPINVAGQKLEIKMDLRQLYTSSPTAPGILALLKGPTESIVSGHIATVDFRPTSIGWELKVYQYTNTAGDVQLIVSTGRLETWPTTSYATYTLTRNWDGMWTIDVGTFVTNVLESAVANGSALGRLDFVDATVTGRARLRYWDNLLITTAVVPEPSTVLLFGVGGVLVSLGIRQSKRG